MRASAVQMFFAHFGLSSKSLPPSTSFVITLRTSYALREEAQVLADREQARAVVGHLEVADARDLRVHLAAAERLFGDVLADHALDEVRPADRHRASALHHRHEVG